MVDTYFCEQSYYDIQAGSGSYVDASDEDNYFSGDPEDYTEGNVDYPEDWQECGLKKSMIASSSGTSAISAVGSDPGWDEYIAATKVYKSIREKLRADREAGLSHEPQKYTADYANAVTQFKQVVVSYPGELSSIKALGKVAACYRDLSQLEAVRDYLNSILQESRFAALRPYALDLFIPYHLSKGEHNRALQLSDEILAAPLDNQLACEILYGKGIIYRYYLNDKDQAAAIFKQVIARYPDHPTALSAQAELEDMGVEYAAGDSTSTPAADGQLVIQSYPNPFNPSSTIRFTLPEEGQVTLKVYDLMGREVATLVNGYIEPGYHQVVWNGKTASGHDVPTGIYIARLITPAATMSIKLVLLK